MNSRTTPSGIPHSHPTTTGQRILVLIVPTCTRTCTSVFYHIPVVTTNVVVVVVVTVVAMTTGGVRPLQRCGSVGALVVAFGTLVQVGTGRRTPRGWRHRRRATTSTSVQWLSVAELGRRRDERLLTPGRRGRFRTLEDRRVQGTIQRALRVVRFVCNGRMRSVTVLGGQGRSFEARKKAHTHTDKRTRERQTSEVVCLCYFVGAKHSLNASDIAPEYETKPLSGR